MESRDVTVKKPAADEFERRYALGVPDELADSARERPRAAVPEPFALRGCVLTPERKIERGYVVIASDEIAEVRSTKPTGGTKIVDTAGVILPGLIDLHGHPEYNVFAAWEPPERYSNRYRWRQSEIYKQVVRQPWTQIAKGEGNLLRDLTRYAEARALVGGVTAIQGASAMYPDRQEALVRNVDLPIFGQHKARSTIDPLKEPDAKVTEFKAGIADGRITALYAHVAEGTDPSSANEFVRFVERGLLTSATVVIHGTALTDSMFSDLKDAGGKLVWSPQSNLRLYGQTTRAATALSLEVPVGLGADWMPSGSQSLLHEAKVARRVLRQQSESLNEDALNKKLVQMLTNEAAAIAGLADFTGSLVAGLVADVVVLERHHDDPWRNVVEADPSWVKLVIIGGDLAYGRPDWISALAGQVSLEPVLAWGEPMLLDTSYRARATGATPPPSLAEIRAKLLARYPQAGPIFA